MPKKFSCKLSASLGVVLPLALLAASASTPGCSRKEPALAPNKPPQVMVEKPIVKEVTDYEDFTGRMESIKSVILRARVTGYLEKVYFQEGADVQEGDLLFEIDRRPYEAEAERAKAAVEQASAKLERMRNEFDRAQKLFKQRAMSKEEADRFGFDMKEAEAVHAAAVASQEIADLNLSFTRITAPFSGRISTKYVDPGNLVQADVTPLSNIVVLDPLYAHFDVDERTLLRVRRLIADGKVKSARESQVNVDVGLADEEGFSLSGIINFVDNQVNPSTGTLRIRCEIPNPRQILLPGLFVRIRVPIGTPHMSNLVPEGAVGSDQGQKFLYVLNDQDEVSYRAVQIGQLEEGMRVIESGISANDRVVVNGLQRIRPGIKVQPTLAKKVAGTAATAPKPQPTPAATKVSATPNEPKS